MKLEKGRELQQCLKLLAGQDDGAEKKDGAGFNKRDTNVGNEFAFISQDKWNEEEVGMIYILLRKYRRQLKAMGVEYDSLPYWIYGKRF